jgi:hypothetical protein
VADLKSEVRKAMDPLMAWLEKILIWINGKIGKKTVKIFCMNEYEWCAGRSLREVRRWYLKEVGGAAEDVEEAYEVCDEGLNDLTFYPEKANSPRHSFRDELGRMIERGDEFPCFFATTED